MSDKVYIVEVGYDYEGFSIDGVYADEVLAQRHKAALAIVNQGDTQEIDDWNINTDVPEWVKRIEAGERMFGLRIRQDGTPIENKYYHAGLIERSDWARNGWLSNGREHKVLFVCRWAKTPDEAQVKAREWYDRFIASGAEWGDKAALEALNVR